MRCKATEEEGVEAEIDALADPESQDHVWREAKVAALYETEEVTTERNPERLSSRQKGSNTMLTFPTLCTSRVWYG